MVAEGGSAMFGYHLGWFGFGFACIQFRMDFGLSQFPPLPIQVAPPSETKEITIFWGFQFVNS